MAAIFLALLLSLFLFGQFVSPDTLPDNFTIINAGQRIHAATEPRAWFSPSRRLAFGFLPQGNNNNSFLVGIWIVDDANNTNNIMVWTANRDNPPVSSNAWIEITAAGRGGKLVLNADSNETFIADPTLEAAAFATMHNNGNFALHGELNSNFIWESFSTPTDTILGDQKLDAGKQLSSRESPTNFSTGKFLLSMQTDGNLVAYSSSVINDKPQDSYWKTGIYSFSPSCYLQLDNGGELLLRDETGPIGQKQINGNYSGGNTATVYRATLDPDGNFRVYANTSTDPLWTALDLPCGARGLCGYNSYCTSTAATDGYHMPSCDCVPGTHLAGGCQRNFTKQKCTDEKSNTTFYYLVVMRQLNFGDDSYFFAKMSEQDCKESCLEDCYCDVAKYDINSCNKFKFPLRYISIDNRSNSPFFFKVGTIKRSESPRNTTIFVIPESVVETSKKTWMQILVITLSLVIYSFLALATSGFFIFKARLIMHYKRLLESGTSSLANELTLRLYSYKELKDATKGFKEMLGKGSFGAVYKGAINNGERLIAVKRLEKLVEEGEREFQSEMRSIGKTHHKHLVNLLGYCTEGSNRLLVYEYMSNGSLADLLYRSERRPDWHERVRIALDVARGILYLHQECDAPIIHCDIKPQNILMDEFWTAKIADFGLAKLLMPDQTRTFTDTRGTRGYLAPEWQKSVPITLKVDVYSYGIVLLEIICCRKSFDLSVSRPEQIQLSGWAYSCFAAGELGKLVGGDDGIDKKSLERMVSVALWCIQGDPILRPSMKGVVLMLEGFMTISTPPCPTDHS